MALKVDFSNIKTKPPTYSGNTACEHCGSKRCSAQGGAFFENGKLEHIHRQFCFDCEKGESFDTRIKQK